MNPHEEILPDWKWGTSEGSRDLDRLLDRRLTFREKLEWLEEAETLSLTLRAARAKIVATRLAAERQQTLRDRQPVAGRHQAPPVSGPSGEPA